MKHAARFGSESTGSSRSVKKFERTLFMNTIANSILPYFVYVHFYLLNKNAKKSQERARNKTGGKGKVFCYFNFQITIAKNSGHLHQNCFAPARWKRVSLSTDHVVKQVA